MNSFTKKLVLYCTGVIFLSFLVVYFLFNVLVSNYIREMAERELSEGLQTAMYMTDFLSLDRLTGTVATVTAPTANEQEDLFAVRWHSGHTTRGVIVEDTVLQLEIQQNLERPTAMEVTIEATEPQFEVPITWTEVGTMGSDSTAVYVSIQEQGLLRRIEMAQDMTELYLISSEIIPIPELAPSFSGYFSGYIETPVQFISEEGTAFIPLESLEIGTRLARGQLHEPYSRIPSIISTNVVMLNSGNEIISPFLPAMTDEGRAEVEFLVGHYLENQAELLSNGMTVISGADSTHFMQTISRQMPYGHGPVSILLYTDISSAIAFQSRMNDILIALLAVSGLFGFTISVIMSAKFKRSVGRLCRYADAIGRGKWNMNIGKFKDSEFTQLSKSMENMSAMLQSYENNQKQFFQNVSHELRTPLMSIQGYAEGILSDVFHKDEAAEIILAEGQKISVMISELLYISRMESGAKTTEYVTSLDVKNVLYECLESIIPIAQNSQKEVTIDVPEYDIIVNADEEQLQRAILNILSNAVRHAQSEIGVSCRIIGKNIVIHVLDDGGGINPDDIPHIFKRFYKGENGNHGLGLAISQEIITNLSGKITAKNSDTGAVFVITLPA